MAQCPNCGNETGGGRVCPNCGTDVTLAAAGASSRPAWTATPPPSAYPSSGLSENTASGLCYLAGFITGIIFLVIPPYNSNRAIRFHAWQSIFLSLAALIVDWLARIIILDVLHMWGFLGTALLSLLHLFWFVVWIFVLVTAFSGKSTRLPIIGDFAARQAETPRR